MVLSDLLGEDNLENINRENHYSHKMLSEAGPEFEESFINEYYKLFHALFPK